MGRDSSPQSGFWFSNQFIVLTFFYFSEFNKNRIRNNILEQTKRHGENRGLYLFCPLFIFLPPPHHTTTTLSTHPPSR